MDSGRSTGYARLGAGLSLLAVMHLTAATLLAGAPTLEGAPSIGVATMQQDGTIVLRLRAVERGVVGEARLIYPPGHSQYQMILHHVGGLTRGETKPVPPWPD
jgi:hypothetical protein